MPEGTSQHAGPAPQAVPRRFSRGGELATFLALAAPWLGAAWASFLVLVPPPGDGEPILPQASGFSWLLCASAFICAWFMWRMIRGGIRFGTLSPFRLLAAGALPWALGLALTPIALFQIWHEIIMQGASIDVVLEPAIAPRLTGLVIGSQLIGAAGFALAVAGFLWRNPGRRWPGLWRALASLTPFSAFVLIWMALDTFTPLPVRAEWMMFALFTLPFRYSLAGAAVARQETSDPGIRWALAVPLAGTILFLAGAGLYVDQTLARAFFMISPSDGAQAWSMFTAAVGSAALFGVLGLPLIVLPEALLLARHYGQGIHLRKAAFDQARILLLASGLVLLGGLGDWHLVALIKDAVLAQPWSQQQIEPPDSASGDSGYATPPPPPPRPAKRVRPIEIPDQGPEGDLPPDSTLGVEPAPGPESPEPESPPLVNFMQLAQRAIFKPEFRIPDEFESLLHQQNQTKVVITMKLLVGEDGGVDDVILLRGSGFEEIDQLAMQTAREWLFRPFFVNGEPIAVASSWTVIYQLE